MSVYPVREDTLFVKEHLPDSLEGENFLEVGVGNGEISLKVAEKGADVTGVDINPEAVQHTRDRFEEENLEGEIVESDLFEKVDGDFDFIVFNPPYLSGREGIGDEEMWRGGKEGLEVAERFLKYVSDYLGEDGRAWIVLSSQTDFERLVENFDLEVVDSEKMWFERLYLLEFR